MQQVIRIGTRGSPLALAQAYDVKARLINAHSDLSDKDISISVIKTSGDIILDRPLMTAGGKGLFTKEIEEALLVGEINCAVHSTKDMPTHLPAGLHLSVFLKREDPRDAFISQNFSSFAELPQGAVLGTASLRRRAQALRLRPDLKLVNFRGNVQSRLRKLGEGQADATFLALAGLNRMDMGSHVTEKLPLDQFLPAPAQGAVTVEVRDDDRDMQARLKPLHCGSTALEVNAERAFLAALDGSCRTPIAALARVDGAEITMEAQLLSLDGSTIFEQTSRCTATLSAAQEMGTASGVTIRADAGPAFFSKLIADIEAYIL